MKAARAPLLALAALVLAGCGKLDREGMVLALDPSLEASILLANGDGITSPDGLLWSDGALYIADEGGSAVRVWRPGQAVATMADRRNGLASPEDLARDRDGVVYASDDDRGGVWRISSGAVAALPAARPARSSEGLALSPGGTLLVGDPAARRILAIAWDGRASALPAAGIRKPESFAFDDRSNLYIADNSDNILYRIGGDGRLHRPISGRPGFAPESLHFAGGILYITDSEHGKLFAYTPEDGLRTIAVFGGSLANVQGVASDESGNLYLSVQSDLGGGRGYILRLSRRDRRPG